MRPRDRDGQPDGCVSATALLRGRPETLACYDLERHAEFDNLFRLAGRTDIRFHLANSLEAEIAPTDLLFIDTYHVYDQLRRELERHAGKVRRFIAMHDTTTFGERGEAEGSRGLWPAVEEFLATHPGVGDLRPIPPQQWPHDPGKGRDRRRDNQERYDALIH